MLIWEAWRSSVCILSFTRLVKHKKSEIKGNGLELKEKDVSRKPRIVGGINILQMEILSIFPKPITCSWTGGKYFWRYQLVQYQQERDRKGRYKGVGSSNIAGLLSKYTYFSYLHTMYVKYIVHYIPIYRWPTDVIRQKKANYNKIYSQQICRYVGTFLIAIGG